MKKALFVVTLLLFWESLAFGQRDGVQTFSATDAHDIDVINLTSLVPSINITLLPKSAGALPGSLAITSPQSCGPYWTGSNYGTACGATSSTNGVLAAFYFIPQEMQNMQVSYTWVTSGSPPNQCTTYTIGGLIGFDQLSFYPLPSTLLYYPSACGVNTATLTTNNNTGITVALSSVNGAPTITSIHNRSGWGETISTSNTLTDTFGNTTVLSSTSFTDSLGAATTLSGSPLPNSYQYTDTSGNSRTISFTNGTATTFYPFDITCGIGNAGASVTPVSSISYPDGTFVSFTWDTTPISGHSGTIDGLIKSVTLRTGATITYTYGSLSRGCSYGGLAAGWAFGSLSRQTPDGTTTYTAGTWTGGYSVTVLDPGKNKTVYDFAGTYSSAGGEGGVFIQQVYNYQNTGSVGTPAYTLISNKKYCYNTDTHCDGTVIPSYPITQRDTYSYLGTGSTQMSHRVETYDSYGNTLTDANTDSINSQTITKTIVYGTWNGTSCVALGNANVLDHPCTITTKNGTTQLAYETFTYNSNGAPTASTEWISSTDTLTTNYTANSNGTMATKTLPNGQVITNTFGNCNSLLLTDSTTTVNSVAIDNKATWNCNGAVITDTTDPNSNEDDYAYDSMNRLSSYTDRLENVTSYVYGTPTLDHVKITDPLSVVKYIYNDGLGRSTNTQVCQTTGCSNLDTSSKSYAWNGTNFETKTYVPCVQTVLNTACTTVALTSDVNPIAGPTLSTDANSGTLTYAVNSKDFSVTAGPAPSQENTKVLQTEVDGFGRVTSTCALTSSGYNGRVSCGQTMGNSGTLTSNTYSFDSTTGAPKVVTTRGSQTHTTITDSIGRPTTITTPESGTTTHAFDSTSTTCTNLGFASSYKGSLTSTQDAAGNTICYAYDGLGRLTDVGSSAESTTNPCRRYRYDSTANAINSSAPTGYPTSANIEGRLMQVETDSPCTAQYVVLTNEWFAYDKDGRITDMWQSSTNSSGYYHTTATYNADGTVTQLTGFPGTTYYFVWGVDGEDRPNSMGVYSGGSLSQAVINTTGFVYDAASRPTTVPIGSTSGDQDTYSYDNVGNMKDFKFTVNSTNFEGALTWNSIGSLNKLVITDGFNSGGSQTCTYGSASPAVEGYDDVGRLLDANCGSSIQHDSWTYDQYDNANRTGNPGTNWNPGYSSTTNEMTGSTYDSNGNVTYDGTASYSWNVYGQMAGTVSGNHTISCGTSGHTCATYDAFGRIVEINSGGSYVQTLYTPIGKVAYMNAQTVAAFYAPAPGGGILYDSGGTMYFQHPDWLGTKRLSTSLAGRAEQYDTAFTPYGESYDTFGTLIPDFTGLTQDLSADLINNIGLFSTPNRQAATNASRWLSPDPAHSGWNAYAYPTDPNTQTDRSGLGCEGGPLDPVDCENPSQSASSGPGGNNNGLTADPFGAVNAMLLAIQGFTNDIVNTTGGGIDANEVNMGLAVVGVETLYNMPMETEAGELMPDTVFTLKTQVVDLPTVSGGSGKIDLWTTPTFEIAQPSEDVLRAARGFAAEHPEFRYAKCGDCGKATAMFQQYAMDRGIYTRFQIINGHQGWGQFESMSNPMFDYTVEYGGEGTWHAVNLTQDGKWVIDMSATQFREAHPEVSYPMIKPVDLFNVFKK